ncbi:DUF4238 domain-containing protein [uncultured Bacteroides sp.]|uniref:DUF4238 domain-containing protein n=1 Tax=uncultured Bacteroides sp. TaxID=162156 RepID=UPI002AAC1560|nr:DUF4238 domain-containing protein [uncultured Bacteroides sp.]
MPNDKNNQYYIPKFYLRTFSYKENKKQIGIYNHTNKFYFQTAPLKTQGSKTFFYGEDGKIENALSKIESILAKEISKIIKSREIPKYNSDGHKLLLYFAALTYLRNPIAIEGIINSRKAVEERILEMDSKVNIDDLTPKITHEEAIEMSLSIINDIANYISDLDYKLLLNITDTKFISSGLPVVRYNQFLEYKKWEHGKTGYGTIGLQIFIPLSPELTIIFFDNKIYKVGNKKHNILEIRDKKDIDKLNQLQYLNSSETLFFSDYTSKFDIENLIENSSKYTMANQTTSQLSSTTRDNIIKKRKRREEKESDYNWKNRMYYKLGNRRNKNVIWC